jgi:hypothetical protein
MAQTQNPLGHLIRPLFNHPRAPIQFTNNPQEKSRIESQYLWNRIGIFVTARHGSESERLKSGRTNNVVNSFSPLVGGQVSSYTMGGFIHLLRKWFLLTSPHSDPSPPGEGRKIQIADGYTGRFDLTDSC